LKPPIAEWNEPTQQSRVSLQRPPSLVSPPSRGRASEACKTQVWPRLGSN